MGVYLKYIGKGLIIVIALAFCGFLSATSVIHLFNDLKNFKLIIYYLFLLTFALLLHKIKNIKIQYKIENVGKISSLICDMLFTIGAWYTVLFLTNSIYSVLSFFVDCNRVAVFNVYGQIESSFSSILILILISIYEELFYRNYLLMDNQRDSKFLMIVSSYIFSVIHLNTIVIPAAYTFGYYCCKVRNKYKSIVPSMICNLIINVLAIVDKSQINYWSAILLLVFIISTASFLKRIISHDTL